MRAPSTGPVLGMVLCYVFFAVAAFGHHFLTLNATASWLDTAAELAIVAIPVSLLMIAAELDLSIASTLSFAAVVVSYLAHEGWPLLAAALVAIALSALIGLFNGVVTTRTGLSSFIVTLGTYFAVGGLTLVFIFLATGSTEVSFTPSGWQRDVFGSTLGQYNVSILWAVAILVLAWWVLLKTVFGNWLLATGGDRESARNSGVHTDRVKVALFTCTAVSAALVGVIQAVEFGGAYVGQGQNFIFDAIIGAVIGGTLLGGGYGSPLGVACGAVTYGLINVGIYYTGWNSDWAQVILGGLTLGAVFANNFARKIALSR